MKLVPYIAASVLVAGASSAGAQGWVPTKNVEIVAGSVPGGSNDRTARLMEHVLNTQKAVPTSITVVNKAGGGGSIAYTYVHQRTRLRQVPTHARCERHAGARGGHPCDRNTVGVDVADVATTIRRERQ